VGALTSRIGKCSLIMVRTSRYAPVHRAACGLPTDRARDSISTSCGARRCVGGAQGAQHQVPGECGLSHCDFVVLLCILLTRITSIATKYGAKCVGKSELALC
jgi:hypothetical protein